MQNLLNKISELPGKIINYLENQELTKETYKETLNYLTKSEIREYLELGLDDAKGSDPGQWDTDILETNLFFIQNQ